jgi:hypothetical protein
MTGSSLQIFQGCNFAQSGYKPIQIFGFGKPDSYSARPNAEVMVVLLRYTTRPEANISGKV